MPSVLIVDDETIFRIGLRRMIASLGEEWEVVGEAKDGAEALERIAELSPDILITDIRMPGMDGLDLQRSVKEQFPDLHVIVLSGHDDFRYAQESIRSGAKDYLTKPVDPDELRQTLNRIAEQYLNVAAESETDAPWIPHLFQSVMEGTADQEQIDILRKAGISFHTETIWGLVIRIDRDSIEDNRFGLADPSLFNLYLRQFVQEAIEPHKHGYVYEISDREVVAFLEGQGKDGASFSICEFAESLRRRIKSLSKLTVTIGIGKPAAGMEELHAAYRSAQFALLHRLIFGGDKVFDVRSLESKKSNSVQKTGTMVAELDQAVHEGKIEQTEELIGRLVGKWCDELPDPDAVQQEACRFVLHYYELAAELFVVKEWLKEREMKDVIVYVCSLSSRRELSDGLRQLIGGLADAIRRRDIQVETNPVDRAIEYMRAHYSSAVTLNVVAEQVFLNPSYFSTLFKQKTGKSFISYLTDIRVSEAKKLLLHTDLKIQAISDRTGFMNIRHFNRVFKNELNLTPKEYREMNKGVG